MLLDSKRPFYWISGFVILGLIAMVTYSEYQKMAEKNSITVFTIAGTMKIHVEFAKTPEELEKGLMDLSSLDKNSGMFFIFSDEKIRSFWMKNVSMPLDIIFISSKGRVNEITTLNPCRENETCQSYNSKTPARYVLEINAGAATKFRIIEGDILELPGL